MELFTTRRERALWIALSAVLLAIYASLGLAGSLAARLGDQFQSLIGDAFVALFAISILGGIIFAWQRSWQEAGVLFGIALSYTLLFLRMSTGMAERTHLFEYGVVAVLLHLALLERSAHGRPVARPALWAILLTALLGTIDELIQAVLPSRVFDPVDIAFNAFAGLLAVCASLALGWARRRADAAGGRPDLQR